MEKPLSLKREDFLAALVKAVNECELPPCVCHEVLCGVTAEVEGLAKRQYEADKAAWEKEQKGDGNSD